VSAFINLDSEDCVFVLYGLRVCHNNLEIKNIKQNLLRNTFVFTTYLKSVGRETKKNYLKGGVVEKRLETTASDVHDNFRSAVQKLPFRSLGGDRAFRPSPLLHPWPDSDAGDTV